MKNFVVFLNTLISDIPGYTGFVSEFADRVHKVAIGPKFSTPKLALHIRIPLENLSCRQTFHRRNDLGRTHPGNALYQKMNMIFVNTYFQKSNLISFRYLKTDFFQTLINCFAENSSAIFRWAHKMIQQYRYIMRLVNVFAFAHKLKVNFSPQAAGN